MSDGIWWHLLTAEGAWRVGEGRCTECSSPIERAGFTRCDACNQDDFLGGLEADFQKDHGSHRAGMEREPFDE